MRTVGLVEEQPVKKAAPKKQAAAKETKPAAKAAKPKSE